MVAHRLVVWNYRWPDGQSARTVIDCGQSTFTLSLFLDDALEDVEEFSNACEAMRRAEQLRLLVAHRGRQANRAS
jgi:hypothetical protein